MRMSLVSTKSGPVLEWLSRCDLDLFGQQKNLRCLPTNFRGNCAEKADRDTQCIKKIDFSSSFRKYLAIYLEVVHESVRLRV